MSELSHRLEQELAKLKTRRDELRVQLDLGKKEIEDAWNEADGKWSKLEGHVRRLKEEGEDTLDDIAGAADHLVEEIKEGFKRLKGFI